MFSFHPIILKRLTHLDSGLCRMPPISTAICIIIYILSLKKKELRPKNELDDFQQSINYHVYVNDCRRRGISQSPIAHIHHTKHFIRTSIYIKCYF